MIFKKLNQQKKLRKAIGFVNKIQKIRSKNNKNWMDLLKLSLKLDYKKTSKILQDIVREDKKVSDMAKKIYKMVKMITTENHQAKHLLIFRTMTLQDV